MMDILMSVAAVYLTFFIIEFIIQVIYLLIL